MPINPLFLELQDVIDLHSMQIEMFGGSHGIRDVNLIESAIHVPQASFGGQFACKDIYEMAAKYLYHLNKNHGFVDGNKRIGAHSALVFLELNNVFLNIRNGDIIDISLGVAEGVLACEDVTKLLRSFSQAQE